MSLNRSEKEAVISEVTSLAAKAQTLVIAEYRGITVADMTKLRVDARSKGVTLSVLKNALARRAVAGSAFDVVADQMTGPLDRKSTRLNSSHIQKSRMPSSA